MIEDIFLARTEEQQQFRRTLSAMLPSGLRKHFPTFSKVLPEDKPDAHPPILLFYGEGGMGKTSLVQRLRKIASEDKDFKGRVNTLLLDWEDAQKLTLDLQVGHDFIEPETVLSVLHRVLVKAGWGDYFGDYDKTVQELRSAESKVEEALRGQPESNLPDKISKLGAKGLAYFIRAQPGAGTLPQEPLENALDTTFQVGAEGLYQARRFVQKSLSPKEYAIYEQPNARLADALGKGIAKLAERKPLVMLLDTYEIVDRPECDYTLRRVIQASSEQALWVIAGRANLADSGQRGKVYFQGYKRDFSEQRLYAKSLSEFGLELIQQYFAQVVPNQSLDDADADAVTRFSLGIPFVIRQAAVMWRDGKPLAEIVAPVATPLGSERSAHDRVVSETSERFLVHCFSAPERKKDLQAIYALALMRRPDPELLRAMLDETDLERRLQTLKERYSFILVEQLRLDEKLNRFLQEYLLNSMRRTSGIVQRLNENAVAWLLLQLEQKANGITDTADKFGEEAISELMLDVAHHHFWQGEDEGWRYLVPRFVEGWQYSRTWARSLIEVAYHFRQLFGQDNRNRLGQFAAVLLDLPDMTHVRVVLDDLYTLERRGWLDGAKAELKTILLIQEGQLLYRQERYGEVLELCSQAESLVPSPSIRLRRDLANTFEQIGWKFSLINRRAVPSSAGKEALSKAVRLNPGNGAHLIALGVVQYGLKQHEQAVEHLSDGIRLEGENSSSLNWLGNVYSDLKRYDEAIAAFQKAIQLDETDAYPHNNLGIVYQALKRYDKAIAAFQKAIQLDETFAYPHNGLGNVYRDLKRYDEAIAAFQKAIQLDATDAYPHNGLGNVYQALKRYDEAIAAYQKAIQLDETFAYPHNGLGNVYLLIQQSDNALEEINQAIDLKPDFADAFASQSRINSLKGNTDAALIDIAKALDLEPKQEFLLTKASIHTQRGENEEAMEIYKQLDQLSPQTLEQMQQGLSVFQSFDGTQTLHMRYLEQMAEAAGISSEEMMAGMQEYLRMAEEDPESISKLFQYQAVMSEAALFEQAKDYQSAIHAYQQAASLFPEDADSRFRLGLNYRLQGQVEQSQEVWRKAIDLVEDDTSDPLNRALYTLAIGNSDQGLQQLDNLLSEGVQPKALKAVLIDSDLLSQCPTPPNRLDEFMARLKDAVSNQDG